jgi:hypothetical protein
LAHEGKFFWSAPLASADPLPNRWFENNRPQKGESDMKKNLGSGKGGTRRLSAGAKRLAVVCSLAAGQAMAQGRFTIAPYASISSSKAIKPEKAGKKDAGATNEKVTQRTTYGLKLDVRMLSMLTFTVNGGMNKVDTTKKVTALRDEFDEIDFVKDFNLDTSNQNAQYRYAEEQRLGVAKLMLTPRLGRFLWIKAGAGVRARQRIITITDKADETKSKKVEDPIRYHAVGTAGVAVKLFGAASAHAEYNFYFIRFPETEPHEQEALIGFGVSI